MLIGLGFITKSGEKISLTPTAESYLLPHGPLYWGPILKPFRDRIEHKKIMDTIQEDNNQLKFKDKTFTEMWKNGSLPPDAAKSFTERMHASIFGPAIEACKSGLLSSTKNLLDVGGGSGCFSIAFTQLYKSRFATVFDLPSVCAVANEYIFKYRAEKNVSTHMGNFFMKDEWPQDYDGVLLSQIVHDWPIEQCKPIIENAYHALPSGGKIYIHEMLLDENLSSPLATACFDLLMFINHKSQQFTKEILSNLLIDCGFKTPKTTHTFGYYSLTVATK